MSEEDQTVREQAEAYLKHAADNMAHAQTMTEAMWQRLSEWQPQRKFQRGELTTGQAAEEVGCTSATIGTYCKQGRIKGAWREESDTGRAWWHIPAESLGKILAEGIVYYSNPDRAVEATKKTWIRQFTEKKTP